MRRLRDLWARLLGRPRNPLFPPLDDELPEPLDLTAFAQLERMLDDWTRWGKRREGHEADEQLAVVGGRVETELRRFFGQDALQHVRSSSQKSGTGTIVFDADRLFVAFLGRRAAMAVTRKLYSDLP